MQSDGKSMRGDVLIAVISSGEDWPKLIGLNVYRLQWQLDPELKNLDDPLKTQGMGFRFQ